MKSEMDVQPTEFQADATAAEEQANPVPTSEGLSSESPRGGHAPRASRRRRRPKRRHKVDLSRVRPGQEYQGRVVSLAKFGAFVDIGMGRDGLLHISELRKGFVDKVDSAIVVGDEVRVWVKNVDQERNRISLTMVEPHGEPRSLKELQPGMVLKGTVEGVAPFGAFVDIGAPVNGLVHISEMAEGYVRRPQSIVSPGDDVEVRVLEVDTGHRKISLSMKGLRTPSIPAREDRGSAVTAMQFAWQRALAAQKAKERSKLTANPKGSIMEAVQPPPGDDES